VAEEAGYCGFIAQLFVIALDMFLGIIFDTVGRKLPTVLGFLLAGTAIIGTPWFTEVYPWFLVMRVMISVGIIPGMNNPLLPDYVQHGSLGLANAYVRYVLSHCGFSKISFRLFLP
jgi:MFS family permease